MKFVILFFIFFAFSEASSSDDLKPLELSPDYEDRMKNVLPELLQQLGIPSSFIPKPDGFFAPAVSTVYKGFKYIKSWGKNTYPNTCKSKLVGGVPKVTKLGRIMCKKKCLEDNRSRFDIMRDAIKIINDGEDKAEVVQDSSKKVYECVAKNDGFDCVCLSNEVVKVSPSLQHLVTQYFGENRTRMVERVSLIKICVLSIIYILQKMGEIARMMVVLPLLILRELLRVIF